MTMLETPGAEVEDPAGGFSPGVPDGGDGPGLVLPEEVVASLAGQLAERARSGEPVMLTGPGGLLTGVIGQVLQAGLAAELGAHLEAGRGRRGEPAERVQRQDAEHGGRARCGWRCRGTGTGASTRCWCRSRPRGATG